MLRHETTGLWVEFENRSLGETTQKTTRKTTQKTVALSFGSAACGPFTESASHAEQLTPVGGQDPAYWSYQRRPLGIARMSGDVG